MVVGMILAFVIIIAGEGALAWCLGRRLGAYLKENPEAVAALTTHLFIPLLGRKETKAKSEPEADQDGEQPQRNGQLEEMV